MVARRLTCRIRRVRAVGSGLGKKARLTQGAVDLVGRDMVETEALFFFLAKILPVGARRLQQRVGAKYICLDEFTGAVDGAVDVGLCR